MAHQVGQEEDRALQDADENQLAARVVVGDLARELLDAVREVVGLDQDLTDGWHGPRV
jgi:hypothetical protein